MYNKLVIIMIAIRLKPILEKKIELMASAQGISKSELVRRSLVEYLQKEENKNAWLIGENLFGKYESENTDLAENSEKYLKNKFKKDSNETSNN